MSFEMQATLTERDLDVTVSVADGSVLAVIGPNGSGKSTTMALTAGLLRPDSGRATLGGRTLFDIAESGTTRTWVAPHDRGVGLLAQEPLLFPHLSVLENVAFGPRSRGATRAGARASALRWLEEVDALALAGRRPDQLSGGQAQRAAVARALATDPELLLLDEPMAALDVAVAPALRQMLRRVLRGRTAVIVTHDVLDALLLADQVLIMENGRVVERGATVDVLSRPRSAFAARIAGLNMIRGIREGNGVRAEGGLLVEGVPDESVPDGHPSVAVFPPSAVAVYRHPPGGSPRNVTSARITELEPLGELIRVRTGTVNADLTPAAIAALDLAPGTDIVMTVKASAVAIYAA